MHCSGHGMCGHRTHPENHLCLGVTGPEPTRRTNTQRARQRAAGFQRCQHRSPGRAGRLARPSAPRSPTPRPRPLARPQRRPAPPAGGAGEDGATRSRTPGSAVPPALKWRQPDCTTSADGSPLPFSEGRRRGAPVTGCAGRGRAAADGPNFLLVPPGGGGCATPAAASAPRPSALLPPAGSGVRRPRARPRQHPRGHAPRAGLAPPPARPAVRAAACPPPRARTDPPRGSVARTPPGLAGGAAPARPGLSVRAGPASSGPLRLGRRLLLPRSLSLL